MITAGERAKEIVKFAEPLLTLSPMQSSNLAELLHTLSEAEYLDLSVDDALIVYSVVSKVISYGDKSIPADLCM